MWSTGLIVQFAMSMAQSCKMQWGVIWAKSEGKSCILHDYGSEKGRAGWARLKSALAEPYARPDPAGRSACRSADREGQRERSVAAARYGEHADCGAAAILNRRGVVIHPRPVVCAGDSFFAAVAQHGFGEFLPAARAVCIFVAHSLKFGAEPRHQSQRR